MKQIFRYLSAFMMAACLVASLSLTAFAAVDKVSPYISGDDGNFLRNKITVSVDGTNDGANDVTITNNTSGAYAITVIDKEKTTNLGITFIRTFYAQTATLTFTNTYDVEISFDYTIANQMSITSVDTSKCTVGSSKITMQPSSSFTVQIQSSDHTGWRGITQNELENKYGKDQYRNYTKKTCTFILSNFQMAETNASIKFVAPEIGGFTVKDADNKDVAVDGNAASSQYYNLTPTNTEGYRFCRWKFTSSSGEVTYFVEADGKGWTSAVDGEVTCEFIPKDAAIYTVDGVPYGYLDQAITAAGKSSSNPKQIVLFGSGSTIGSNGEKKFTIPSDVQLVLPYAEKASTVQSSTASFAYGNYTQANLGNANWYPNPINPGTTNEKLKLTIPQGTTIVNNGTIAVGATLSGSAAVCGDHATLEVDGELHLYSPTSVLSACGYVTGSGTVKANGLTNAAGTGTDAAGAKIYQPMVLLRVDSHGWLLSASSTNMQTSPKDANDGGVSSNNPSPRYTTQNIQCNLEMAYGDTMNGYLDQVMSSTHYMTNVPLVGQGTGLIGLKSGTTLSTSYASGKVSDTYPTIGKLTVTITGNGTESSGATQGTMSADLGIEIDMSKWPFPVPYNYDFILKKGTYDLYYDLSLLPGAGLKVEHGATLNIKSGKSLAVFTGANDHSVMPALSKSSSYPTVVVAKGGSVTTDTGEYKNALSGSRRYPANSTLGAVSGGSYMANFVVDGVLNINGSFGGIVQTNGTGTINMNVAPKTIYRQFGMTGDCYDSSNSRFAHAGATVYAFEPQVIGVDGQPFAMTAQATYKAANNTATDIPHLAYDLYPNSANTKEIIEVTDEELNATAVGQWYTSPAVIFYANDGTENMAIQEVTAGTTVTLNANAFTHPEGLVFAGWNTAADGSGTAYADGAEITVSADTTLYAQWKVSAFTLTLDPNGGTVDTATKEIKTGEAYGDLPTPTAPDGSETPCFQGWFTASEGGDKVEATTTVTATSAHTLYAHWAAHSYDEGVVTAEPNCVDKGEKTFTCSTCGDSYTEDVDALNHDFTEQSESVCTVANAGDCQTYKTYYTDCSRCDQDGTEIWTSTTKGNHVQATTYSSDGTNHWHECTVCGEDLNKAYCSGGTATCTAKATCSVCGNQYGETLAHDYDKSTYQKDGTNHWYKCKNCSAKTEVTGHSYEAVVTAPKCTEEGYTTYTCECGYSYTGDTVAATGHTYVNHDAKDPGCLTIGWDAYQTCENCSYTSYVEKPATGHTEETLPAVAATCTTSGLTEGKKCTTCNTVTVAQQTVNAKGHSAVVDAAVAADCTNTGLTEGSHCSVCGAVIVAQTEIPALGHTAVVDEAVAPTCGTGGLTEGSHCSVCDEVLVAQEPVDRLGHTEVIDAAVAATCTTTGLTEGKHCSSCGEVIVAQEVVSALGHSEVIDEGYAKTCTADGLTDGKHCNRCDVVLVAQEIIPAGHEWDSATGECTACDAVCTHTFDADTDTVCDTCGFGCEHVMNDIVTKPDCNNGGYTTHTCTKDCGFTYTSDEKPATGHTPGAEADCTNPQICTVCKEILVPATGHTSGATVEEVKIAATCTTDGLYENVVYCTVCNTELSREDGDTIPATGHEYTSTVTAPTCTEQGYTTHTCGNTGCEDSYVDTYVDATGHSYGEWEVTTPATCTEAGEERRDCANCDGFETQPIKAAGHDETSVVTAPTCTAEGFTTYTCSTCGNIRTGDAVDATGHTNAAAVKENYVAATCTTAGSYDTVIDCTVCGKEVSRVTTTVDALGHTSGTAVQENVNPATCGQDGSYDSVVYCTVCSAELSRTPATIPATGEHHYNEGEVTTPATCTEAGVLTKTCTACGATTTEDIPATGHTAGDVVVENNVDPTCTVDGSYDNAVYCSVCDAELSCDTVVVPATGHTTGDVVVENNVDPTCTVDGSYDNVTYCTVCGTETSRETVAVDALGHKYESVVTEPTCSAGGYTTYTCSVCDDTYTADEVEATGHDYKAVVTAPTCTKDGYTTYTCANCDDSYVADETDATGHSYTGSVTKEATCTEAGMMTYTCSCGASYTKEIAALGHTEETISGKEATCTETGLTDGVKCSVCGEILTAQEEIPALGHNYNAVVTAPTCTEAGFTTYTCSVCGDSYVDGETEALGHDYVETVTPATCTEDGAKTYTCSSCGDSYSEAIPATGHNYVDGVCACGEKEACEHTGGTADCQNLAVCELCGEEYGELGDHTPGEEVQENYVASTPTSIGSYIAVVSCSECGEELSRETKAALLNPFTSTNMELQNSLSMGFVLKLDTLPIGDNYAVISRLNDDGWYVVDEVPQNEWSTYTNGRHKIDYPNINAKEMTVRFKVIIYNSHGEAISVAYEDSVCDYATRAINTLIDRGASAEQIRVFVDMLNYGAAVQEKLDFKENDLANANLTETQKAFASSTVNATNEQVTGPYYSSSAVSAESRVELGFLFYQANVTRDMYAVVTYTHHNGVVYQDTVYGSEFEAYSNARWRIPVDELSTVDGGQLVTCTVYDANGNEVSCAKDSVNSYLVRAYEKTNAEVYIMTLRFTTSAYAFFH